MIPMKQIHYRLQAVSVRKLCRYSLLNGSPLYSCHRILYYFKLNNKYNHSCQKHCRRLYQLCIRKHDCRQTEYSGYGIKNSHRLLLIEAKVYESVVYMFFVSLEGIFLLYILLKKKNGFKSG